MASKTTQTSNTVIKIKESCVSRQTPNDKGKKVNSLSAGAQYYVFKITKTSGKTWYRISENSAAKAAWVNSKYCKLLDVKQTKKAIKSGLVSTSSTQYATSSTSGEKLLGSKALDKEMASLVATKRNTVSKAIDGSMRLFGMPHQLTASADRRLSDVTELGTMFTEKFIMSAPIIYLKPGTSNFLPGMSDTEKSNIVNSIINSAKGSDKGSTLVKTLANMEDNDWRYFDFEEDYASYIRNVNTLCRLCAVFTGLNSTKVPWQSNLTYGSYDWSGYTFETLYNDSSAAKVSLAKGVDQKKPETSFFKKVLKVSKNAASKLKTAVSDLLSDENYVRFYVDASVSFSESVSNGTSQSIIDSYISDSLSSLGEELSFVSGATGIDVDKILNSSASTIDSTVNAVLKGDGAITKFLKRLTGTGKQVLAGSNFISPEVWSSNDYSKTYSFAVTLASPYGDIESWYLNIAVPLMHLLAMALPKQDTANTYTAPFLVRAYSPGWFSCDLGVIESLTIEKAPSGDAWGANSLPLEIKVGIGIKELYSSLAIPDNNNFKVFFANTGLLNYLMINCGFDITKQSLDLQVTVFINIFTNTLHDAVDETVNSIWYNVKETIRKKFGLWQ